MIPFSTEESALLAGKTWLEKGFCGWKVFAAKSEKHDCFYYGLSLGEWGSDSYIRIFPVLADNTEIISESNGVTSSYSHARDPQDAMSKLSDKLHGAYCDVENMREDYSKL